MVGAMNRSETPVGEDRVGPRFADALTYAFELHGGQRRKGIAIPYIAHLMGVAALVIEDGGDEDEAIAALLHDAAEDQGGGGTLEEIRRRFGAAVADIVEACSDTLEQPKPPWRPRKERHLDDLRAAPRSVLRVSVADKLYNARMILKDYRRLGDDLWDRFNVGKEDQLWYYRALADTFSRRYPGYLSQELDRVVMELEALGRKRAELADRDLPDREVP